MSRIHVIPPEEATGQLKEIYNELMEKRGKIAEVHKIQSLRPKSIMKHMDLYLEIMFSKSELSRAEREMMAVIVSVNNQCEYCWLHHGEALNHYWKDQEKINRLINNFQDAGLSDRHLALCYFARELTINPANFEDDSCIEWLKEKGFDDHAILDATLVVSYFNFVNRMVLALGVEANEDEIKGYNF